MANIVIAEGSLTDAATFAAGSEAATLPVSNLATIQPGDVWRATDLAAAWVTIDLGAAAAIDLIGLLYTNASSAATFRVRAAATEADVTASPGYDSGSLTLWPTTGLEDWDWVHRVLFLGASGGTGDGAQSYRYWRVDVSDAGNADGYFQMGRLMLAASWQPTRNLGFGWSLGWIDESPQKQAIGGQSSSLDRRARRVLNWSLDWMNEADANEAFELDRTVGRKKPVLVVRDPATASRAQRQTIYGKQQQLQLVDERAFQLYRKRYQIEEMLP